MTKRHSLSDAVNLLEQPFGVRYRVLAEVSRQVEPEIDERPELDVAIFGVNRARRVPAIYLAIALAETK